MWWSCTHMAGQQWCMLCWRPYRNSLACALQSLASIPSAPSRHVWHAFLCRMHHVGGEAEIRSPMPVTCACCAASLLWSAVWLEMCASEYQAPVCLAADYLEQISDHALIWHRLVMQQACKMTTRLALDISCHHHR